MRSKTVGLQHRSKNVSANGESLNQSCLLGEPVSPRDEPALGTHGGGTGGAAAGGVQSYAFVVGDLSSMAYGAYLRWRLLGFFIAVTVCLL